MVDTTQKLYHKHNHTVHDIIIHGTVDNLYVMTYRDKTGLWCTFCSPEFLEHSFTNTDPYIPLPERGEDIYTAYRS
jgi:hypothetical protein